MEADKYTPEQKTCDKPAVTLASVMAHIRELPTDGERLMYLNEVAEEHHVRVRHEFSAESSRGLDVYVDATGQLRFEKQPRSFISQSVSRIQLATYKGFENVNSPFNMECNGVVIAVPEWKIICTPPLHCMQATSATRKLDLAEFEIICVENGTTVTIYPYDHIILGEIWCIATRHGYDVSAFKWIGDETYGELIYDVLKDRMAVTYMEFEDGIWRLGFPELDRNKCYTIGFHSNAFHTALSSELTAWGISSVDLTTGERTIGCPDLPVSAQRHARDGITYAEMLAECIGSVDAAGSGLCFGFIMRRLDLPYSIMLKSELYRRLEKYIYASPSKEVQKQLSPETRLEYNILSNYMAHDEHGREFIEMFPQYSPFFAHYKMCFDALVNAVIRHNTQTHMGRLPKKTPYSEYIRMISDHISRHANIITLGDETRSIILDYLKSPELTPICFAMMRNGRYIS